MLLNVPDFPDYSPSGPDALQAALNAARDGDRVHVPGPARYTAPAGGWEVRSGVEIFGDGPGNADTDPVTNSGTILHPHSASTSDHVIRLVARRQDAARVDHPIDLQQVYIHDLRLTAPTTSRGGGDGIHFSSSGTDEKLTGMRLERLAISRLGRHGISLRGLNAGNAFVNTLVITNCVIHDCGARAIDLVLNFATAIIGSYCSAGGLEALGCELGGEIALYTCAFDGFGMTGTVPLVVLDSVAQARLQACRFAGFGGTNMKTGLSLKNINGPAIVSTCAFELDQMEPLAVGLDLAFEQAAATGVVIVMPNRFVNVGTAVKGNTTSSQSLHGLFVAPQFGTPTQYGSPPQNACVVALPTLADHATGGAPSVSNEAASRSVGLLIPPIAIDPLEVLPPSHLIYNTTADKLRLGTMDGFLDVVLT